MKKLNIKITPKMRWEVNRVELKLKVKINSFEELKDLMEEIKRIEKEYSCNCTLLEVEVD